MSEQSTNKVTDAAHKSAATQKQQSRGPNVIGNDHEIDAEASVLEAAHDLQALLMEDNQPSKGDDILLSSPERPQSVGGGMMPRSRKKK